MFLKNKSLLRRMVDEIVIRGNLDRMEDFFAPNHVVHDPANPARDGSINGMKHFFEMSGKIFKVKEYLIDEMIAENDLVVYRWTMKSDHIGTFMGVPSTGKEITTTGMEMFRLMDGKIAETWIISDISAIMGQLGLLSKN